MLDPRRVRNPVAGLTAYPGRCSLRNAIFVSNFMGAVQCIHGIPEIEARASQPYRARRSCGYKRHLAVIFAFQLNEHLHTHAASTNLQTNASICTR